MKFRNFFQNKIWKKWDKSQWTILILAGILLMVVAIPTGDNKKEEEQNVMSEPAESTKEKDDYERKMEKKLKDTLSKIEGAGKVDVMITLEDSGESVVEKDMEKETSDLNETDTAGGSRTEKSTRTTHAAVYSEQNSEKTPFVGKEKTPKVSGVLVVAEGGENTAVKQNISEAVMALFQIDVNRIKVVKMNIQEERH